MPLKSAPFKQSPGRGGLFGGKFDAEWDGVPNPAEVGYVLLGYIENLPGYIFENDL
jgi:hypothetical protein